eukprot:Blabericola_migrator_1__6010@NODE_3029_length_2101_cov_20_844149_g1894_i0_p4_GENE_NODE_3029_length_2101_cov_20_844149_g1894_i0NODE_3029_length_2101_cov_20_844149_g1894_i0_p4_ORF_typecomplete_len102_score10_38_NODE_3029_length_2101_cov_20_844149_g1894_i0547852
MMGAPYQGNIQIEVWHIHLEELASTSYAPQRPPGSTLSQSCLDPRESHPGRCRVESLVNDNSTSCNGRRSANPRSRDVQDVGASQLFVQTLQMVSSLKLFQ